MKRLWFKEWGWIYRPASVVGMILTLLLIAFCLQTFVAVDRNSHSVSDTFYGIFPFWAPTLLAIAWLADRTGGRRP